MKTHPPLPSPKELSFGWRYIPFHLLFLGGLLNLLFTLLKHPLNNAQLNGLFFLVNFAAVSIAFREFLWAELRLALDRLPRVLLTALVGFLCYEAVITGLGWVIAKLAPGFANVNDQSIGALSRENYLLTALGTVFLVPLTEEVLYRGTVFAPLCRRSVPVAYLVSTVLFSLVHIHGYFGATDPVTLLICFVQYLPAGVCLAFCYRYSGSLFAPVLIHAAVNALGILSMR